LAQPKLNPSYKQLQLLTLLPVSWPPAAGRATPSRCTEAKAGRKIC